MLTPVERFRAVMDFKPVDRLPRWEWAMWWDRTIENWKAQGLPPRLSSVFDIAEYLELDPFQQFWISTTSGTDAVQHHVDGNVGTMDEYRAALPALFPDHAADFEAMRPWAARQARGEVVLWATLEGFYWFPRTLMGIERHMYSFFDSPELMHTMNRDLLAWTLRSLERMFLVCKPTFVTIAEDMSYNHGPMLSRALFDEFLAPYYRPLVSFLRGQGIYVIVDTDGDVTEMVPWLSGVGIQGVLPLERQAGVDGQRIRALQPDFRLVGHFDKMVMNSGEAAMRAEFERLVPLMKAGGFIPSVDHQTPPHVSLQEYRVYRRLLDEYTTAAAV
jgi:hypothetical protein